MKRTLPTDKGAAVYDFSGVLEYACPVCPARPGESCIGGIAEREGVPHPPRVGKYLDATAVGLKDRHARISEFKDVP